MTHEHIPAARPNQEAVVPKRVNEFQDVAYNEALPLLHTRALDVGTIYEINPTRYPYEYMHFRQQVEQACLDGALDLDAFYPDMEMTEQIDAFTKDRVDEAIILSRTVEAQDAREEELLDTVDDLSDKLVSKEKEIQEVKTAAAKRLVLIRLMMDRTGATDEQIDGLNQIISDHAQELEELLSRESDTDRLRALMANLGHKAVSGARMILTTITPTRERSL